MSPAFWVRVMRQSEVPGRAFSCTTQGALSPSAAAPPPGQPGRFLDAHQLDTLRAVAARLIPGPPDDPDPGAVEAGAPEAVDLLLAAFTVDPPLIHAGGPFSNRAGADHDDFADFVP